MTMEPVMMDDVPVIVAALLATATVPGPSLGVPADEHVRTILYWGFELDEAELEWAMGVPQPERCSTNPYVAGSADYRRWLFERLHSDYCGEWTL